MAKKKLFKDFIDKSNLIHGNNEKYSYDQSEYVDTQTPIKIKCLQCGHYFYQKPSKHMLGQGCPNCKKPKKYTLKTLREKINKLYKGRYEVIPLEEYKNNKSYINLICHKKDCNGNEHGMFRVRINKLLSGHSCPKCGGTLRMTKDEFMAKATEIHGKHYDYSKSNYVNSKTKILIKCNKCNNEFWQTPHNHLSGNGCPYCKNYKLEKDLFNMFKDNKIKFIQHFKFDSNPSRHYDFAIPQINLLIECQGEQHFKPTAFNGKIDMEELYEIFEKQRKRDIEIFDVSEKENHELIYYTNPFSFRNKEKINFSIDSGWYSDKKVFINKKKLLSFILNKIKK